MKKFSPIGIASLLTLSLLSLAPAAQAHDEDGCDKNQLAKFYYCGQSCGSTGWGDARVLVTNVYTAKGRLIFSTCREERSEQSCQKIADKLNSQQ